MDRKFTSSPHNNGYEQLALADVGTPIVSPEPSPTVIGSYPTSPHPAADRTSIQFAKAAFIFKDKLQDVRNNANKRTTLVHQDEVLPTPPPVTSSDADPKKQEKDSGTNDVDDPIAARRLQTLTLTQSSLTSFLSIAIATLQARAYATYQSTKDTPGAWPTHPNLMPTILLMVIALLAATFDLGVLLAHVFPSRAAQLLRVANKSHGLMVCVKGLSYLLASVVCRSGFDYGNASGTNNDLWGWTCSEKAAEMGEVTRAGAQCDGQTAAWYIALAQVLIEGLGVVGTVWIHQQSRKARGDKGGLLSDTAELEKLIAWGQEVDKTLTGATPQAGGNKGIV
ncbi:hypothetical protein QBC34DRAFT_437813 [Podospora aff. communis PSN243]|uniref:MARVEL domain-containing protein n=1 Tax=Podospora aff. communis PSN243 TaxID=3040156 RepID=A0AAV9GQE6_9PEZI|nr:hypothetical protein QBC34DRAFT_437813 [Podospora aff. communis PSN243]